MADAPREATGECSRCGNYDRHALWCDYHPDHYKQEAEDLASRTLAALDALDALDNSDTFWARERVRADLEGLRLVERNSYILLDEDAAAFRLMFISGLRLTAERYGVTP